MRQLLCALLISWLGVFFLQADNIESKMRTMVEEVQKALQNEDSPDIKGVESIIQNYCNMDTVCTTVAKPYLLQKTKDMDREAKKTFIADFLPSFKPVYTAYLARVWASDNNAKTFKNYKLASCTVNDKDVFLTFVNEKSNEKSYIALVLDDKSLIVSIKFGTDKANMIDPIAADRDNCQAGASKGEAPEKTFA